MPFARRPTTLKERRLFASINPREPAHMAYTLIKGSFHIHYPAIPLSGPEPDGDTIKFQPDNPQLVERLPRPNRMPGFNQAGITSIRFEGVDALETHFDVEDTEFHQHLPLALAARDALMARIGFGAIKYFDSHPYKVETVETHPVRGYILSMGLDTYGRSVAFVYTGEHPSIDGSRIFMQPHMLDTSLNAFMLHHGHAYGAFYLGLPPELREHLRRSVRHARDNRLGFWAQAPSMSTGITLDGVDALQNGILWPKLFRRIAPYFQAGHTNFDAFDAWLRQDTRNRDDRLLLPTMEVGNLHDMIRAQGTTLRLMFAPEDVVIVPDDYILPATVGGVLPSRPRHPSGVRIICALVNPIERPEHGNETVTLLNASNQDVDLTGWRIADAKGSQTISGHIARGETLRIALSSAVKLNNDRDTITVLAPGEQIVDQVAYEPKDLPDEGVSVTF
ncbi:hypothetical protein FHP91_15740 [Denitromonas halophila]|uniref:LTD domain-containing protein n=2 Tax=Denitromonas halophila TaxID=1629404 RepID=A0A557QK08_9RHOO|nr:hypothetical protein FHP91_15740 [Denitromonas halophila]